MSARDPAAKRREVTERDLRRPEFRDADPTDLEFRDDGVLVRRDRWERGIREIASVVGYDPREDFEIADVVAAVRLALVQRPKAKG